MKQEQERYEELETKAEKITPTYVKDGSMGGAGTDSKIERNVIAMVECRNRIEFLQMKVDLVDLMLSKLKSHQRYLIKSCMIYNNSYQEVALRENTSEKNIQKIIDTALDAGVDAIHPGYGFLAENPSFAEICEAHKIKFFILQKISQKSRSFASSTRLFAKQNINHNESCIFLKGN